MPQCIFVGGGTRYIDRHLIPKIVARGHTVRGLVRNESRNNIPAQPTPVFGDALNRQSYQQSISPADSFIHLIGVSQPTFRHMVQSVIWGVENPPEEGNGLRIVDVPEIKRRGKV